MENAIDSAPRSRRSWRCHWLRSRSSRPLLNDIPEIVTRGAYNPPCHGVYVCTVFKSSLPRLRTLFRIAGFREAGRVALSPPHRDQDEEVGVSIPRSGEWIECIEIGTFVARPRIAVWEPAVFHGSRVSLALLRSPSFLSPSLSLTALLPNSALPASSEHRSTRICRVLITRNCSSVYFPSNGRNDFPTGFYLELDTSMYLPRAPSTMRARRVHRWKSSGEAGPCPSRNEISTFNPA